MKVGFLFEKREAEAVDPILQTAQSELRRWTLELLPDAEFQILKLDFKPPKPDAPPEPPPKVDLILWNEAGPPLTKLRSIPEYKDTPVIAIVSDPHMADPTHPAVQTSSDILLLPTERLIYLQKLELLLAKDEAVTQSFLFELKLETEDPKLRFDIGKRVQITHLSETSCTVISPVPMLRGLEGTLASNVFWNERESPSWKDRLVEVRVQDSMPYLDSTMASSEATDMKYEVRLRYFALRQSQLRNLRVWLAKNLKAKWPDIERSPNKAKQSFRVALISPRADAETTMRSSLENLTNIDIVRHQGLQGFLLDLKEKSVSPQAKTENHTTLAVSEIPYPPDFIGPRQQKKMIPPLHHASVRFTIKSDDLFIEKIDPPPKAGARLMGHSLAVWEKDASLLIQALGPSERTIFQETLDWIASGTRAELADRKSSLHLTFQPVPWICQKFDTRLRLVSPREGQNSPVVEIELTHEPTNEPTSEPASYSAQDKTTRPTSSDTENTSHTGFEAIMIDASLLKTLSGEPGLIRERFQSIEAAMEKASLKNAFGNPPPVVLFSADDDFDATSLRGTVVRQLIYRFEDRRYFAELFISLSRPELWTSPGLAVAEFAADLDAAIFRPTKLEAISEAGFRIVDRIPFKSAATLRVLSSLWPNREQPIWARVRRVQANESLYAEDFVFLAVDDEIQRAIRNYGLQEHVNRKKSQMS